MKKKYNKDWKFEVIKQKTGTYYIHLEDTSIKGEDISTGVGGLSEKDLLVIVEKIVRLLKADLIKADLKE